MPNYLCTVYRHQQKLLRQLINETNELFIPIKTIGLDEKNNIN